MRPTCRSAWAAEQRLSLAPPGGVAEAVIRRVSGKKTYNLLREIKYSGVRGMDRSVKEAAVQVGDDEIRIAVVHGLKNAQELLKKIERGEVSYHLVEVMACPGGCIGGCRPAVRPVPRKEPACTRTLPGG